MQDQDLQDPANDTSGGAAPAYDPYAQIRAIYQQITGGKYTPTQADLSQWGTNLDSSYLQKIQGAIGNWWQQQQAQQPTPTAAPAAPQASPDAPGATPAPAPDPQPPPDIYNGALTKPYDGTFTPPAPVNLGGPAGIPYIPPTPTFTGANAPPQLGNIPQFQAPSVADALNDPGYQFRRDQGMFGIQNAAAAKGTLNDSSAFKSLSDYNQNAASQEYDNVWNRALNTYGTNLQSQYLLPFQANEQNWTASVLNPTMAGYTTQAGAGQSQNALNYTNAWDQFLNGQNQYNDWQDRTWNKLFQAASY